MNKEDLEKEIAKGNVSPIAFYNPGGSSILYTQKYVEEKNKEIQRLNNIIDELEKYIEENIKITKQALKFEGLDVFDKKKYSRDITLFEMILDKLKELKEDVK